jgi:hypothetical protein
MTETTHLSLDRMSDLGRVTLLPGHGKSWQGDINDAIRQARQGKQ